MDRLKKEILSTLYDLGEKDFELFKWHLKLVGEVEGIQPLQTYHLEHADRKKTVDLIVQTYKTHSTQIVGNVLEEIQKADLQETFLNRTKGR